MGATNPAVPFNSIASSTAVMPLQIPYSPWGPKTISAPTVSLHASSVPGFVSAMFQVQIQVPNPLPSGFGMDIGNGVRQVQFGLLLNPPPISAITILNSNTVTVYVK